MAIGLRTKFDHLVCREVSWCWGWVAINVVDRRRTYLASRRLHRRRRKVTFTDSPLRNDRWRLALRLANEYTPTLRVLYWFPHSPPFFSCPTLQRMEHAPKRRKTAKACDNCRRQKSRCEWNATSDESPNGSCHRCRVLTQSCTIDGQPPAQDTHRVSTPGSGPSNAPTPGTPKQDNTSPAAGILEQERGVLRYQPSFHEWLHSLENSESFFTDLGKLAWSTPMAMLTRLMAWHDGRPFTPDIGKDPASSGVLSRQEVRELLSV